MKYEFPKGFLWGASTSAHQVEGGTNNDWGEWEKENASDLANEAEHKFGRLPNWKDIKAEATEPQNYISGIASDHFNRYKEDFKLAGELGHNATRLSIEWSRIEPEEGVFDEEAILHYKDVIKTCNELGLEPFVTLWHWTLPLWLRDKGGLQYKYFAQCFGRYAAKITGELKHGVKFWITLNEPFSVMQNSYLAGKWPPQKRNPFVFWKMYKILAKAHNTAYESIKKTDPKSEIGLSSIMNFFEAHGQRSPLDKWIVKIADYFHNQKLLNLTSGKNDFIAINYYFHDRLRLPGFQANTNKKVSDMNWELYPEGLYHIIKKFSGYKLPIYITEHGLADAKDEKRAWYITESLKKMHRAMAEGADVRGYLHWSLMDNFEWDKGFWPRFGLIEIDRKTLERKIRPSAYIYKKIIKDNGIIE